MSKISELSDGGSLVSSDYLIAVRSGGNVKVRMDQINVDQVDLGDNEFIRLGNSQDLTMVHTPTQSIINQAGIGDLLLQKAGATKLTINSTGIDVTGTVTATGTASLNSGNGAGTALQVGGESGGGIKTRYVFSGASQHNWQLGFATHLSQTFSITPSSAVGNTTFTTPALNINGSTGAATFAGSVTADGLTTTTGTSMTQLTVNGAGAIESGVNFANGGTTYGQIYFNNVSPYDMSVLQQYSTGSLIFGTNDTERMRIDASGRVLIGHSTAKGYALDVDKANLGAASFNRTGTDGEVVSIRKDGTTVGSIGVDSGDNLYIGGSAASHSGLYFGTHTAAPITAGTLTDAVTDLGTAGYRFKDLYLSGGVYLGGTGAANKLEDYEEGTWTPVTGAGNISGTSITYTGKYTKVGRLVTVYFRAYTASNNLNVASYQLFSGLPFAADYMSGTGTAITEDIDQFDRQGFSSVGGTSFAISNSGSSSGTTTIEATVTYFTS